MVDELWRLSTERLNSNIFCTLLFVWLFLACNEVRGDLVRNHGNILRNEIDIDQNSTTIKILATRIEGNSGIGRNVKTTFSIETFPWWRIQRWNQQNEASGLQFRMGLLALVEYQESLNGTDGLDPSDYVVSTYPLWDVSWAPFSENSGVGDDMLNYYVYSTLSTDQNITNPFIKLSGGIADIRAWVTQASRVLGPNTWEWELNLSNYPLQGNCSRLAIKCVIEYMGDKPTKRADIPLPQRDSLLEDEDDMILSVTNQTNFNLEDTTDQGFFSWTKDAMDIGGLQPEIQSVLLDITNHERSLRVVSSPILTTEEDLVPLPASISFLEDITNGRILAEQRYYIYFSFMVTEPSQIVWDPFVGLDEQDIPVLVLASEVTMLRPSLVFLVFLLGFFYL